MDLLCSLMSTGVPHLLHPPMHTTHSLLPMHPMHTMHTMPRLRPTSPMHPMQVVGKPQLVERLRALLRRVWPVRPQLVIKHGIPAALALLNETRGELRAAAQVCLGWG